MRFCPWRPALPGLFLCSLWADPAPPTRTPAGTVAPVVALKIQLPELPRDREGLQRRYAELKPRMRQGLADLDAMLVDLYASPEVAMALPTHLKVPSRRREEARLLMSLLAEHRYGPEEKALDEAWRDLERRLVVSGAAVGARQGGDVRQEARTEAVRRGPSEVEAWRSRLKGYRFPISEMRDAQVLEEYMNTPGGGKRARMSKQEFLNEMATQAPRVGRTMIAMDVTKEAAPVLNEAWQALADRLNADALLLADVDWTEVGRQYPDLRCLDVHSRIWFLERFRSALWFSAHAWSVLAQDTAPPRLKVLGLASPRG